MPQFVIQQNESGIWFYELLSPEGSVLLTGTKHDFKQSCLGEILSVRMNSQYLENFEQRISPNKDPFFILRSMGSNKVIGVSEFFSHLDGCEKAIAQVRKWAENAKLK
ncbi:MAG: hypothetical protein CVU07_04590 [Bacteroidetes bacterium HGW-Bacteroidetes-23]|nr:MAG: hypothetical protein CVU07_04590 [Bacteroidetes bacterium HGW-Bacteroidetes-23]